jgi:hypothetical protein
MIEENGIQQIDIPTPCPKCGSKMFSQRSIKSGLFISRTVWIVCWNENCNYEISADEFKRNLLTV